MAFEATDWIEWRANARAHERLRSLSQQYNDLLLQWLLQTVAFTGANQIKDYYDHLASGKPDRARIFLTSPQTYNCLSAPLRIKCVPDISFLERSLLAEILLEGNNGELGLNNTPQAYWTSLGDYLISQDGKSIAHGVWHGTLWVDGSSIHNQFDHGKGFEDVEPYRSEKLLTCLRSIGDSIAWLEQRSPDAATFVKQALRSLVLHDAKLNGRFISGSRASHIGKAGLVNLGVASRCDLVDAIIHESVHSVLYMIELFEEFYLYEKRGIDIRLESPWTGRALALHSYTHACYVWYSLVLHWSSHSEAEADAKAKFERALHGFRKGRLTSPLIGQVADSVLAAIEHMQDQIRESF